MGKCYKCDKEAELNHRDLCPECENKRRHDDTDTLPLPGDILGTTEPPKSG